MASHTGASSSSQDKPMYTDRESRISKENLHMVLALKMEEFPLQDDEQKEINPYRKVGAVLVLPNDMLYAADCSRDGVHGVARLLMRHYDVARDCKIFVSRKPCSFCTKLLVQCKINRVCYLPIEPEYKDQDETSRVDMLFQRNPISQSVFVPSVGIDVLESAKNKRGASEDNRKKISSDLMEAYWKEEWIERAKDDLPWSAFDDNMKRQVKKDFELTMEWMARNLIGVKDNTIKASSHNKNPYFDPAAENNVLERKQASHLITIAKFLAERSDDPKTGVGAVITNTALEVVALGWNGFPTKALYGEFPRASHDDTEVKEKKYPYAIHAEQNALIFRNTKNLAEGILFVTKTPCDECTPLLVMEGIKTVVLSCQIEKQETAGNRTYATSKFPEKVKSGVFTCYEMSSGEPAAAAK